MPESVNSVPRPHLKVTTRKLSQEFLEGEVYLYAPPLMAFVPVFLRVVNGRLERWTHGTWSVEGVDLSLLQDQYRSYPNLIVDYFPPEEFGTELMIRMKSDL